jgi:amidohydrolase
MHAERRIAMTDAIADLHQDMIAWRHDLHAHPELGFQEHRTADFVAKKLAEFGIEVHRGIAGTGVVGTLRSGGGSRAIAFRADMDALPIEEKNDVAYASKLPGVMHACGHDGHTATLLGAARHLATTRDFDGTVHFVFQPAEENDGGGKRMVEEGLLARFPVENVFALHNWPGVEVGKLAVRVGPQMAARDNFSIHVRGTGSHAAMPHLGDDPVIAAARIVVDAQAIVSRTVDPLKAAVLSFTQVHGGNTLNVVPGDVTLAGTCRFLEASVGAHVAARLARLCRTVGEDCGVAVTLDYQKGYPPTVNTAPAVGIAVAAAGNVFGPDNVVTEFNPSMGSEDFAYMLAAQSGCYAWLGAGPATAGKLLHQPNYDFNDALLPLGVRYFVSVVEAVLGKPSNR